MSKGGGGGSQTVTNVTQIPQFIQDMMQSNLSTVQGIQSQPYQPYTGELVAPIAPATQDAWGLAASQIGSQQPTMDAAKGMVQGAGNTTVPTITPQTYASGLQGLGAYMNPYMQDVIDASQGTFNQALQRNLQSIKDSAIGAGAYGGSRQGVQEGAAAEQNALDQANFAANLRNQGFGQAAGLLGQDIGNNLTAQGQNATNIANDARTKLLAGSQLGSLGAQDQAVQGNDVNALNAIGQQAQQERQAIDSADYGQYQDWRQYPIDMANLGIAAVGNTPFARNSTSTSSGGTSTNPLMGGLGGAVLGSSLFGTGGALAATGLGATGGGLLGGGLGLLAALSDKNEKTDIQKVGKDDQTGLDLYAYRYKSDPKTYPKVVGPMAQDIAKRFPGATKKVGGKLVVNGLAGFAA